MPLLSVVVPVFNGARYLGAALDSVLDQAGGSVELIISDDGSTDASRSVIAGYSNRPSVIVIDGPGRGNWVSNTNRAIDRSHGRFVTILHQDDLWLPGHWAAINECLALLPDCAMWINPSHFIDGHGRIVGTWRLPFRSATGRIQPTEFIERLLVQNFLGMPAPVFPRYVFDHVGGLDESLWYTADWDLWLKLAVRGPVGIHPEYTTAFRLHAESQTSHGVSSVESMRTQTEIVRSRYLDLIADRDSREATLRAGNFSTELNAAVASLMGRHRIRWRALGHSLLKLGTGGASRFLANARFLERSIARLRIGLAREIRTQRSGVKVC